MANLPVIHTPYGAQCYALFPVWERTRDRVVRASSSAVYSSVGLGALMAIGAHTQNAASER